MNGVIAILSLLTIPLSTAAPLTETGSLSSTNAAYDGNALVLTGHVILDHGLGKMNAEEASLQRQDGGKDFPFSLIHLNKEVLLSLKNNAELRCETADLDFTSLKGLLHAKDGDKVVYTDSVKKKKGEVPVRLASQLVELGFAKKGHDGKKTDYDIETILAQEAVTIDYAQDFVLQADHALYRKQTPQDQKSASREFQGIITAYPKENAQCRLTHIGGDVIDADSVDLDMVHAKISMLHPKGTLQSTIIPHLQKGAMRFSCDHLVWDQDKNILSLKGGVQVEENIIGTLTALEELTLEQTLHQGKRLLKTIRTQGPTTLLYVDPVNGQSHKLVSHGTLIVDRDRLTASLESPQIDGRIPLEKQTYYENGEIGIFADKANLEYSLSDTLLQPVSLILNGNIRLFSHDKQNPPRCGLADRLSYSLDTRTIILSANPGKKVLFWDAAEGVTVSAQEVHITQDKETKEQTIKGVGKVQFSFSSEENSLLKQLFPQYQISQGNTQ